MGCISKEQYENYPKTVLCENGEYKPSFEQFKEDVIKYSKECRPHLWEVYDYEEHYRKYEDDIREDYYNIGIIPVYSKCGPYIIKGSNLSMYNQYNNAVTGLVFSIAFLG